MCMWRNSRLLGSYIREKTNPGVSKPDIYEFCGLILHHCGEVNMGCNNSTNNAVQPLIPEEVMGDEDETGSKRGDSAVSKGTTDSGVVMENREIPVLPGAVPAKLPPLPCVRECEVDRITQNGLRPESSKILEELLNQGIIPVEQTLEKSCRSAEAYSIMLDDGEGVRRRPPARLESLKAKRQSVPSQKEIEEKIRLADERRKSREDKLKTRLRAMSARVRGPAPVPSTEEEEDTALTPVEVLEYPFTPGPLSPPPNIKIAQEEAEGNVHTREAAGDGKERKRKEEIGRADRREGNKDGGESGDNRRENAEKVDEDNDREKEEDELTQVEEFNMDQLLGTLGEMENDHSFQHAEDKEEIF